MENDSEELGPIRGSVMLGIWRENFFARYRREKIVFGIVREKSFNEFS